jgi:hypothetical protein
MVVLAATVTEEMIRKALMSRVWRDLLAAKQAGATSGFLGGLFKKLKKIAKGSLSVVSNLARLKIGKALKSAVSLVKEGLPVVALAIPGLGLVAGPVMTAASSLLSRAAKGDPRAKAALAKNAAAARQGDPAALRRSRILTAAAMKQRANRRRAGAMPVRAPLDPELAAIAGQGGWRTAASGQQVWDPHALASGVLWDQLRPRLGFRSTSVAPLTSRTAYADGVNVLASLRR